MNVADALHQNAPILSVASFRTWLESRPDEEHWELIEGVPKMMTPRNRRHQRIASNLESLINTALKRHNPAFVAYHDIGMNIVSTVPYDPEPDVAVIREDENPDPRYADRFLSGCGSAVRERQGHHRKQARHLPGASNLHLYPAGAPGSRGNYR
jgi:Uma2 family endonuclease